MPEVRAHAPDGVPEVTEGADLAGLLLEVATPEDGDVVVVTSKVVSKAEGRRRSMGGARGREQAVVDETHRVVARRGATTIARTRHGLTMAAAGVDASNVAAGEVLLLPEDPDGSARVLRRTIRERTGRNVAVVVSDTAGRAWRHGQTDIAVGAAGLLVLEDFAGRTDAHGNELAVTAPAVADEIAGLAELASGKLGGRPFTLVRGREDLVLPAGEDGPGAAALVRPDGADMFGYGSREAVLAALVGDESSRAPFGAPAGHDEVAAAVVSLGIELVESAPDAVVAAPDGPAAAARIEALAHAHGWRGVPGSTPGAGALRLVPDGSVHFPVVPTEQTQ